MICKIIIRAYFDEALKDGVELVCCSNTNSKESEYQYYIDLAEKYGYIVFCVVMEKRFISGNNGHNCPEKSLIRQQENIKQSLKLR